jgi:hypothetical protein
VGGSGWQVFFLDFPALMGIFGALHSLLVLGMLFGADFVVPTEAGSDLLQATLPRDAPDFELILRTVKGEDLTATSKFYRT